MDLQYSFEDKRVHYTEYHSEPNELTIFVDYGDANYETTFDHHPISDGTCSASIINSKDGMSRLEKAFLYASSNSIRTIRIVTHSNPDLDSVASATTVIRFSKNIKQPLSPSLIEYVRLKDQGEDFAEDPKQSVSLLFQAIKNQTHSDIEIMKRGIQMLEIIDKSITSCRFYVGWNELSEIKGLQETFASELASLNKIVVNYHSILKNSLKALLALPKEKDGKQYFQWAEAVFLDFASKESEPLGWKDIIRSEKKNTIFNSPFVFSGVRSKKRGRDNFIFSVPNQLGFSLKGLGAYLDNLEESLSSQLSTQKNWPKKIQTIATERGGANSPTLIRSKTAPRDGYSNSDPWYDGRGHNYCIVDTPESGSVLEPNNILLAILKRYCPFWKEWTNKDNVLSKKLLIKNGSVTAINDWIVKAIPCWNEVKAIASSNKRDKNYCLADIVKSLSMFDSVQDKCAFYIPVLPCSSYIIPKLNSDLYIYLALYLIAHKQDVLSSSLPRIETVNSWASRFVFSPFPGRWISVSDQMGIVMFDYMPDKTSVEFFEEIVNSYFDFAKQLKWTDSLSSVVKQKKRYEALLDFVERVKLF